MSVKFGYLIRAQEDNKAVNLFHLLKPSPNKQLQLLVDWIKGKKTATEVMDILVLLDGCVYQNDFDVFHTCKTMYFTH